MVAERALSILPDRRGGLIAVLEGEGQRLVSKEGGRQKQVAPKAGNFGDQFQGSWGLMERHWVPDCRLGSDQEFLLSMAEKSLVFL